MTRRIDNSVEKPYKRTKVIVVDAGVTVKPPSILNSRKMRLRKYKDIMLTRRVKNERTFDMDFLAFIEFSHFFLVSGLSKASFESKRIKMKCKVPS